MTGCIPTPGRQKETSSYLVALLGELQGGGQAGQATAHHHHTLGHAPGQSRGVERVPGFVGRWVGGWVGWGGWGGWGRTVLYLLRMDDAGWFGEASGGPEQQQGRGQQQQRAQGREHCCVFCCGVCVWVCGGLDCCHVVVDSRQRANSNWSVAVCDAAAAVAGTKPQGETRPPPRTTTTTRRRSFSFSWS